jgi:hypothetical protein
MMVQPQLFPLATCPSPSTVRGVGDGLTPLLTDVQTRVVMIRLKSGEAGLPSAPITPLVNLEQQITAYDETFPSAESCPFFLSPGLDRDPLIKFGPGTFIIPANWTLLRNSKRTFVT